jgi:hypothetical protein
MANLFNAAESPTIEPEGIVVGDFIQWRRTDLSGDYPNTAYTMTYVARITGGGNTEIQLVGTNYNDDYLFSASSTTSASFVAGYYHWQLEAFQTSSSNRIVIDRGAFNIIVDLDVNGTDPRTHAEIMVSKIESLLSGKADADVANYSIAGRSLTKMSFDELVKVRDFYKAEFRKEQIADRIRQGRDTGSTVKVRF